MAVVKQPSGEQTVGTVGTVHHLAMGKRKRGLSGLAGVRFGVLGRRASF